jgi:hypothetical protein
MAAQFTQITLPEMETYLKRAFRALRPQHGASRGEVVINLFLNEAKTIGIRIWTSIHPNSGMGAGQGEDAIRVQFYNFGKDRPMVPDKAPIVKRTQNWRDNLKDRIEDYMELYESKDEYWESRV